MERRTSQTRVLDGTGRLRVRGRPRPGKDVMSRLTLCVSPSEAGCAGAAGALERVDTAAMV